MKNPSLVLILIGTPLLFAASVRCQRACNSSHRLLRASLKRGCIHARSRKTIAFRIPTIYPCFLRSLSPRFKMIVYNIQHESWRPSRIVRHDSSRYQTPTSASFLHFEPPPFKMEGRYSNLDLKYEFSASNST